MCTEVSNDGKQRAGPSEASLSFYVAVTFGNASSTVHRSSTLSRWNCGSLDVCSDGTERDLIFLESRICCKEVYLY